MRFFKFSLDLHFSHNGGRSQAAQQVFLVHNLNGVEQATVLLPRKDDLRIASLSNYLQNFKIVDGHVRGVHTLLDGFLIPSY